MRKNLLAAAGLLASAAACAGPAAAADLPAVTPPPTQPPVAASPAYVPDWVGFYFGFHGGSGWDHISFDVPTAAFTLPGTTLSGNVLGGQAGYNWQYGQIVGGIEVDFSSADLKQTSFLAIPGAVGLISRDAKVDELASARGRVGWSMVPYLLAYATAGIGLAQTRLSFTNTATGFTTSADESALGWVAGFGVEYRLFEHILLRGEFLHYDFGKVTFPDLVTPGDNINVRNRVDVVRGGISYKF